MSPLITEKLVILSLDSPDRHAATRMLAENLAEEGRVTDLEGFLATLRERENQKSTGISGGVSIPHARSSYVTEPSLAFGRSPQGVEWGAEDGPAKLIFLIAAPLDEGRERFTIRASKPAGSWVLAALARRLMHTSFRRSLMDAPDPTAVVDIVTQEVVNA
ncbi:MAG: fructose system component [Actinomycetota bacterium]|jgi:PTS system fructose-specific IIA component|nr:fructose system component [Actinomycetota bacterium]